MGAAANFRAALEAERPLQIVGAINAYTAMLAEKARDRDLYLVTYKTKQTLQQRLAANVESALERADAAGWRRKFESRLPR